jgi:hypothetical protein
MLERANSREGGVGTEAQIISAKVYERTEQNKFAAIVRELDADGKPLLPHYMATRLYFDMSSTEAEALNFEKVVRWIFGKPFHSAPPVGQPPKYLESTYAPIAHRLLTGERLRHLRGLGTDAARTAAADILADIGTSSRELIYSLRSRSSRTSTAHS